MQSISPETIFRGNDAWEKALPQIVNLTKSPLILGRSVHTNNIKNKIYRDLNSLLKSKNLFFIIRPSGTEPLLRVNLQYQQRNIKVSELRKLQKNIKEIIANAC